MIDDNKALVRRYYEEVLNGRDLSVVAELFAPAFVSYTPSGRSVDLAEYVRAIGVSHAALPNLHVTIEDQFAEGDRVVTRWSATGTHRGPFAGIAPTGKAITVTAMHIHRIADGKLAEHWEQFDLYGLLRQLGALPAPG